jgi:restriction system protein
MNMSNKAWMVRAGEGGYLFDDFKNGSYVAIGWNEIGEVNLNESIEDLKTRLRIVYPDTKEGNIRSSATQISKFIHTLKIDDYVVSYNRITRLYLIGKLISDYKYDETIQYYQRRDVQWITEKSRDLLEPASRNTLGSTLTIFEINKSVLDDLLRNIGTDAFVSDDKTENEEELDEIKADVIGRAHEFIKDKLINLSWEMMQDFVAGLLRAMGYITKVSDKGPDRGKDIIASPDGLGLEEPRIKVEVKHRSGSMGSQEVRSFIGSIRNEKGLYVSTGGFTKEAKYEAERSDKPVTLVDLDTLVWITTQYYDKFDSEAKAILPLKKVFWPL